MTKHAIDRLLSVKYGDDMYVKMQVEVTEQKDGSFIVKLTVLT